MNINEKIYRLRLKLHRLESQKNNSNKKYIYVIIGRKIIGDKTHLKLVKASKSPYVLENYIEHSDKLGLSEYPVELVGITKIPLMTSSVDTLLKSWYL